VNHQSFRISTSLKAAASRPHSQSAFGAGTYVHPVYDILFTNAISEAQRVTGITAGQNNYQIPQALAQNITYTPSGALSQLTDGCVGTGCTQIQETYDYNDRLQPVRMQLGTSSNTSADYCLVYNYYQGFSNPTSCTGKPTQSSTGNNGNVAGFWYEDNVNTSFSHTEAFGYDTVKRLTSAVATGSSTYNLSFRYTADGSNGQYGNMSCVVNGQTNGLCPQYSFNANNQISGYTYDAAGNTTNDGTYTYQWDAEGRLSQSLQGTTTIHTYTYNALGERAEDIPAAQTTNTQDWFYDPSGQPWGDFFTNPPHPSGGT